METAYCLRRLGIAEFSHKQTPKESVAKRRARRRFRATFNNGDQHVSNCTSRAVIHDMFGCDGKLQHFPSTRSIAVGYTLSVLGCIAATRYLQASVAFGRKSGRHSDPTDNIYWPIPAGRATEILRLNRPSTIR